MAIRNILTDQKGPLRKKSENIDLNNADLKELGKLSLDMAETMLNNDGIGLAAPQIGLNLRAVVINTKEGIIFMVNPRISRKSLIKEWGEEGCLSVPRIYGQVKRHKSVTCMYSSLDKKEMKIKAEGLLARVIQHELDHLDGILFIDKAKKLVEDKKDKDGT